MSAIILQFKRPLNTYIVEGYKTIPGEPGQCYRFKVQAETLDQAWYKADIIATDNLLDTYMVWRQERPETRRK